MDTTARQWGRNIKSRRQMLGISQTKLGDTVGVHQTTVSKWERGDIRPSHRLIPHLAQALHADVGMLFPYDKVA